MAETKEEQVKKWVAIEHIKDELDNDKIYKPGEDYPRPANKKISEKRLKSLSTKNNKLNKPVIKEKE